MGHKTHDINQTVTNCRQVVQNAWDDCDQLILEHLNTPVAMIHDIIRHTLCQGGKRLRPLLLLLSAGLCDNLNREMVEYATSIEFIHAATLLHDDVVDHSALRRGLETAAAAWGDKASILVGDYLYSRAFEMLAKNNNNQVLQILLQVTTRMSEGEVTQLTQRGNDARCTDEYFNTIERKTAGLFQAAAQIGAVGDHVATEKHTALKNYGYHLGMCFQIIDDILDYQADADELGKQLGDDLEEQNLTLPLILTLKSLPNSQADALRNTITQGRDALADVVSAMHKTNALEQAYAFAKQHHDQACAALKTFNSDKYKQALLQLAQVALERGK